MAQRCRLYEFGLVNRKLDPGRDPAEGTIADFGVRWKKHEEMPTTFTIGRFYHSAMPSMTLSVIVEIVCRDTSAPYTSARCALISSVVRPLADSDRTMSSTRSAGVAVS